MSEQPAQSQYDDDALEGEGDPVATGPNGGGEWPDPDSPPDPRAAGSDPAERARIEAERAHVRDGVDPAMKSALDGGDDAVSASGLQPAPDEA